MKRIWRYSTISRFLDYGQDTGEDEFDAMYDRVLAGLSERLSVTEDASVDEFDYYASRYVDPSHSIGIVANLSGCSPATFAELSACAKTLDDGFYISVDATQDCGQAHLVFFRSGEVWGYSESRKAARILHRFGFPRHLILG
jgi:hypothetical protein